MMMNSQTHVVIDGYVDAIPAPGTGWGTACLDLIHSPADADRIAPDTPDTVYACTTGDPRIADLLLREIQPGDLLRVTGTIVQPDAPGAPARLTVDALEVLDAAPAPVLHGLVLECWSDYVSSSTQTATPCRCSQRPGRGSACPPVPTRSSTSSTRTRRAVERDDDRRRAAHRPGVVPCRPPLQLPAR